MPQLDGSGPRFKREIQEGDLGGIRDQSYKPQNVPFRNQQRAVVSRRYEIKRLIIVKCRAHCEVVTTGVLFGPFYVPLEGGVSASPTAPLCLEAAILSEPMNAEHCLWGAPGRRQQQCSVQALMLRTFAACHKKHLWAHFWTFLTTAQTEWSRQDQRSQTASMCIRPNPTRPEPTSMCIRPCVKCHSIRENSTWLCSDSKSKNAKKIRAFEGPRGCFLPHCPLCDIPSGCCFLTGPWTVTRSSLRMLRRIAAFCRLLRPVLLLVSFPRSRSPIAGVLELCWLRQVSFVR